MRKRITTFSWLCHALTALLLLMPITLVQANDGLRTTDYYLHHQSKEPFYAEQGMSSDVIVHVREVILPGREASVASDGKALLLVHGATFPAAVAFDLDYEDASMMRHFARLGWDVFALDLEGYGESTRPPTMDHPEAFHDAKAPIGLEVTLADVDRAVDFIRDLRGVDKVHLFGWSAGAFFEVPNYAVQAPDKVASMVLYGGRYANWNTPKKQAETDAKLNKVKVRFGLPADPSRMFSLSKEEYFIPGILPVYAAAHLASDPMSGALGGRIRAPWGRFVGYGDHLFDAAKITVPTLILYGEDDPIIRAGDNENLMAALGSERKEHIKIPKAGHMGMLEITNQQFYKAVRDFLEAE